MSASSNKKTININPELFKIHGRGSSKSQTKSNRERKYRIEKPITPNILKKQLIERIKNHKKKLEQQQQSINKSSQFVNKKEKNNNYANENDDNDDEFIMSMNYLSSLSDKTPTQTQTPTNNETNYIVSKQQNQYIIEPHNHPQINIELPDNLKNTYQQPQQPDLAPLTLLKELEELKEFENINEDNDAQLLPKTDIKIKYERPNDVPYGCLKNGSKPTYRHWMTQKNDIHKNQLPLPLPKNNSSILLEREKRLNDLKCRLKEDHTPINATHAAPIYIKKTIHRKYTLGKSKLYRKVGVLIKNMQTRKKVIDSHKELKTHNVNDIKKYLRNRGLIKIGNHTPTDLLRKLYETTILTGDVNNSNKETLLHNLMNEQPNEQYF